MRFAEGPHFAIYALAEGNHCEALDYLCHPRKRSRPDDIYGMVDRLRDVAQHGLPHGCTSFVKKLKGSEHCYEFRVGKLRMFWFYDPRPGRRRTIVLTHAWPKANKREQDQQVARAERYYRMYIDNPPTII